MYTLQHRIEGTTLILERVFPAPRQRVWDAFTQPELFIQWWGPKGWSTVVKEFSLTEGGVNLYGMKCEDPAQAEWYGKFSWGKMVFSDISPIESIRYKDYFVNENGVEQEGMPVSDTFMELIEVPEGTKMVTRTEYESEEALNTVISMGMLEGIGQTWDRLEEMLS